jgi:hypothetical protein
LQQVQTIASRAHSVLSQEDVDIVYIYLLNRLDSKGIYVNPVWKALLHGIQIGALHERHLPAFALTLFFEFTHNTGFEHFEFGQ